MNAILTVYIILRYKVSRTIRLHHCHGKPVKYLYTYKCNPIKGNFFIKKYTYFTDTLLQKKITKFTKLYQIFLTNTTVNFNTNYPNEL